jgi:class 3 adenylate cyclase
MDGQNLGEPDEFGDYDDKQQSRGQIRQNANTFWKKLVGDGQMYDQSETETAVYELFADYFTAKRHSMLALLFPACNIFCIYPLIDGKGGDKVTTVATVSVVLQFVMFGSLHGITYFQNYSLEAYSQWFLRCLAVSSILIFIVSIFELVHGGRNLEAAMASVGSYRTLALFTFAAGMDTLQANHIFASACAPAALFLLVLLICQLTQDDEMDRDSAKRRFDLLLQECAPFIAGAVPMCYTVPIFYDRYYELTSEVVAASSDVALKCQLTTKLLFSVLPEEVVPEFIERSLRQNTSSEIIENFEQTTILFLKVIGLGQLSNRLSTYEIVSLFHELVCRFDELTVLHQVEKIRTDFGVYLLASGLPTRSERHAIKMSNMALSLIKAIAKFSSDMELGGAEELSVKIGMSSGSVVAGVIGTSRYQYDLVGDTVNTAARMCSSCASGKIQVTDSTHHILVDEPHLHFRSLGIKNIKGKGAMEIFQMSSIDEQSDYLAAKHNFRCSEGARGLQSWDNNQAAQGGGEAGGEAAMASRESSPIRAGQKHFRAGDRVKVTKEGGSTHGHDATIIDPNWTDGRVKVQMVSNDKTKSYLPHELELVQTPSSPSSAKKTRTVTSNLAAVAGMPRQFPPSLPKRANLMSPPKLPPLESSGGANTIPVVRGPPADQGLAAGETALARAQEAEALEKQEIDKVAEGSEAATKRANEIMAQAGESDVPALEAEREEQTMQNDNEQEGSSRGSSRAGSPRTSAKLTGSRPSSRPSSPLRSSRLLHKSGSPVSPKRSLSTRHTLRTRNTSGPIDG